MSIKPSIVLLSGLILSSGLAMPTLAISADNIFEQRKEEMLKEHAERQRAQETRKEEYKAREEQLTKERTERQRNLETSKEENKAREEQLTKERAERQRKYDSRNEEYKARDAERDRDYRKETDRRSER